MQFYKYLAFSILIFLLVGTTAQASEQSLACKLMTKEISSTNVKVPGGHSVLSAFRDGGVCLFEDGSVADKVFVAANMAAADFSTGLYAGFSVYTFENGDSLTLSFTGGWGEEGNKGDYRVVSGTGQYSGATGTGSFTDLDSPWDGTSWFDIAIYVSLPD